jgi:hypothetical protein
MAPIDTKLTGAAGEHYVCSMLARYGWAASLTRDGLERTDVLAVHSVTRTMIEVQVKTLRAGGSWLLGRKGTLPAVSDHEWFAFVRLGPAPDPPESWLVPRNHVAAATWIGHMSWLLDPSAEAGKRNAGIESARMGEEVWAGYKDAWTDLGASTTDVAVRLPVWMKAKMSSGDIPPLPNDHPWLDPTRVPAWPGPT